MKKWFVIALVVLSLVSCGRSSPQTPQTDAARTLASLQKVDDYPLYVMTYYGDYGFEERLGGAPQAGWRESGDDEWACTTFAALGGEGDALLGRNFDWFNRPSLLLFTDPPNGYASASMVDVSYLGLDEREPSEAERQALLDAPYLPFDGMNEAGVAIGMMAISRSQYDSGSRNTTLSSLEVIRLVLDYAGSVEEALVLMGNYNIDFGDGPPVHYLVADSSGNAAIVEFIDNEMRVIRNAGPWLVSTNFIVSEERPAGAGSSCWRYNTAYRGLEQADGRLLREEALALLADTSQDITMWSVVYDITSGDIQVVMGREYDNVHEFRLSMSVGD